MACRYCIKESMNRSKLSTNRKARSRNPSLAPWRVLRAAIGVAILVLSGCGEGEPARVKVLLEEGAVEFPAVVATADFTGTVAETGGYHLIVWKDGSAADKALFRAEVSDIEFLDALETLGAIPGDGLTLATWDDRFDKGSWRPDQVIEGPPVGILIRVRGQERLLELGDFLDDSLGSGFEMRFGGHRGNIPEWRSGCVVCLYSCPGSKIGNAKYTVRDYVQESTRFTVKEGVLPKDGSRVTVRVELVGLVEKGSD